MLPINAISLAAAILQFVDFSGKLIVTGHEMYKAVGGATQTNAQIESRTAELRELLKNIEANQNTAAALSSDEQTLAALTAECEGLCSELTTILDGLKVKGQGIMRKVDSARFAIKSWHSSEEVKGARKRLDKLQQNVDTCLLNMIRRELGTFAPSIAGLKNMHVAHQQQVNNLQAVLMTAGTQQVLDLDALRESQKTMSEASETAFGLLHSKLDHILETTRVTSMLETLYFPDMHTRFNQVADSHEGTFEWIFERDSTPFKTWLSDSNDVFWIRGKAGSGKSTLVKFVAEHETTGQLLQKWAGGEPLLVASFYFWNSGSAMQKSQEGLLRSLLYQIIRRFPALACVASPTRWKSGNHSMAHTDSWSRKELEAALHAIARKSDLHARFCFFIDGLDEFHGEHHALADDLMKLASSPAIKLCVSSRPWNPFEAKFGQDQRFKFTMEDLTKEDMDRYIKDNLKDHSLFMQLARESKYDADLLAGEIRYKAEGVFLWVYLVVRSLLRGLSEGDNIFMLCERLNSLPSDLHDLFRHTLENLDEVYRKYTSCALLIVSAHYLDEERDSLDVLALWYLDQYLQNPSMSLSTSTTIQPFLRQEWPAMHDVASKLVNKWCKDLLQVYHNHFSNDKYLDHCHVDFPHRTIADFVRSEEVNVELLAHAGKDFDVHFTMSHVHLAMAASMHTQSFPDVDTFVNKFSESCDLVIRSAKYCKAIDSTLLQLFQELDRLGQRTFDDPNLAALRSGLQLPNDYIGTEPHWSVLLRSVPYWSRVDLPRAFPAGYDFCSYVASHGLTQYMIWLAESGLSIHCESALFVAPLYDSSDLETIAHLLKLGANPNKPIRWISQDGIRLSSVWEQLTTLELGFGSMSFINACLPVWTVMLEYGADPGVLKPGSKARKRILRILGQHQNRRGEGYDAERNGESDEGEDYEGEDDEDMSTVYALHVGELGEVSIASFFHDVDRRIEEAALADAERTTPQGRLPKDLVDKKKKRRRQLLAKNGVRDGSQHGSSRLVIGRPGTTSIQRSKR